MICILMMFATLNYQGEILKKKKKNKDVIFFNVHKLFPGSKLVPMETFKKKIKYDLTVQFLSSLKYMK